MFQSLKTKVLSTTAVISAAIIANAPQALAQGTSGIFDTGTDKGEEILNDLMNGPMKLLAGFAILGVAIFFMLGKLPVKMAALIVVGALLLGASQDIIDFIFS
jgi:hypothetical protein